MKTRVVIVLLALVLTVSLVARDKTDVMVMKNGDRVTCEIKGLDAGVLYVNFDYIDGTALVDWSKVARLESKQLFVVKMQDGSVYVGMLMTPETTPGRPLMIKVVISLGAFLFFVMLRYMSDSSLRFQSSSQPN